MAVCIINRLLLLHLHRTCSMIDIMLLSLVVEIRLRCGITIVVDRSWSIADTHVIEGIVWLHHRVGLLVILLLG